MKQLFWRLTMIFWGLFVIVVISFARTFYLQYEKNYSQKLLEIDRDLVNVGEQLNGEINLYTSLVKAAESMVRSTYQKKFEYYTELNDEYVKNIGISNEVSLQTEQEIQDYCAALAYENTVSQIDVVLDEITNVYKQYYSVEDLYMIPVNVEYSISQLITNHEPTTFLSDDMKIYSFLQEDRDEYRKLIVLKEVMTEDKQSLGTIVLQYKDVFINSSLMNSPNNTHNNIFFIDDQLYLQNNNLLPKVSDQIKQADFETALKILSENGYNVMTYKIASDNISIIHYESSKGLNQIVLKQTISLFEFSTIVLIVLFLFVSYLLFIAIIRPCYLLIDYVQRCGEGDYVIPNQINSAWRSSFLKVRNTYLENERLLAVKDNQSQELELAWKRSLVANQAKTHFLAKVSHELKTPLNAIKGYVQLLKLSVDHPKQLKQIDIIDRSSDLLLKLVNELLEFSVVEDGKIILDCQAFNVHQTAHVIEELFYLSTKSKNLDYEVSVDEKIPDTLFGDEGRIKQIIINLVSNALKFTESGRIEVSFDLDYQTEIEAYLSVRVKDTGKGIAENKLNAIFESFTQENNSISRQFGGTGLGLSISKRLAEAMGGSLIVESKLNEGSVFTLFIPLSKAEKEELS